MRKYVKMFAVGAAAVMLSGGTWFVPGTLSYAAEDSTTETDTAASTTLKSELVLDSQEVARGALITVNVNLLENPGLTLEDGILSYDTDVLELTTCTNEDGETVYSVASKDLFNIPGYEDSMTSLYTAPIPHNGKIRLLDGYARYKKNSEATGTMFTLTFKVKDDAVIGTSGTFKYEGIFYGYVSDTESSSYLSECESLNYTVVCTHQTTTEKVVKEADYGIAGEKQIICSDCGNVIETQEIPALEYIEEGEQLQVKDVTDDETKNYDETYVSKLLKDQETDISNVKFKFYEINMLDQDNNIVEPEGTVTVRIPCPEGFVIAKCRIYYVADDGVLTDMKAEYRDNYLYFKTTHFSTYLLTDTEMVTETKPEISAILYGDVDGDGTITLMDSALIRRSLAGWNVTIDTAAADVNRDGEVGLMDSALIRRSLAGWNVTLGVKQ